MNKLLALACVVLLVAYTGCVDGNSPSSVKNDAIADLPHAKNSNATPSVKNAKEKDVQAMDFSYPLNVDDISKVVQQLKKIKYDEFSTLEENESVALAGIKKLMGDREYLIFKAREFRDVDGTPVPSLRYYPDEKKALLVDHTITFDWFKSYNVSIRYGESHTIISQTKKSRRTGVNAFGVSNTYEFENGKTISLYFKNYGSIRDSIQVSNFHSDDARRLKNNLTVFFVVVPEASGGIPCVINDKYYSAPAINAARAWNIDNTILVTKVKAVLLCDKKNKEIVNVIRFKD